MTVSGAFGLTVGDIGSTGSGRTTGTGGTGLFSTGIGKGSGWEFGSTNTGVGGLGSLGIFVLN